MASQHLGDTSCVETKLLFCWQGEPGPVGVSGPTGPRGAPVSFSSPKSTSRVSPLNLTNRLSSSG